VNFIVTILNERAPGMSLMRVPVFTWMTLVVSFLLLFAIPVIAIALFELGFDRLFGTVFFKPEAGGDPLLWQHLFWLFGHPEVYILVLPAMGIVSEVLPTFSRKPLFGYAAVVFSGIAIGFMSWGVWVHHMYTTGLGTVANSAFGISTILIGVPTGVKVLNWMATMWGGSLSLKAPMMFAIGFVAMFTIGGLSGVTHSVVPSDYQQQDTYYVVAHFHYVLVAGSLFAIFGGVYFWLPKWTGRMYDETLGKWHFWLSMIFFNITFFPMHFLGLAGMPRRIADYALQFADYNMVASIGAFGFGLSQLIFFWVVLKCTVLARGEKAPGNPWEGADTLEWTHLPSPPPYHSFETPPTVR
jgi:cytochrome c oxidase subunit 1